MGCMSSLSKYILFFFNFVILISAILLITYGAISLSKVNQPIANSTQGLAIAVGLFSLVVSFLGCCGAYKQNKCLLTTYVVILVLILIVQVSLAILGFVLIKDEQDLFIEVDKAITELIQNTNHAAIYDIQKALHCCGRLTMLDWGLPPYPKSCCEDEKEPCMLPYTVGCSTKVYEFLHDNIKIVACVAIAFAAVELLAAIFACMVRFKKGGQYA